MNNYPRLSKMGTFVSKSKVTPTPPPIRPQIKKERVITPAIRKEFYRRIEEYDAIVAALCTKCGSSYSATCDCELRRFANSLSEREIAIIEGKSNSASKRQLIIVL